MASLSLSSSNGVVYWTISGLTETNYADAGIAASAANGTTTPPSGIMDSYGAFSTPPTSISGSFSYPAGTYTFYAYGTPLNGKYYPAGSANVTIAKTNFAWDIPKTSGSSTITAAEWNKLIQYIVGKRGSFTFTYAAVGNSLSAEMYNQLINGMGASSSYLVSAGDAITAAKLNLLVTLANNL